jgi:hypothetical protein
MQMPRLSQSCNNGSIMGQLLDLGMTTSLLSPPGRPTYS